MQDGRWHIRWRPLHTPSGIDCRIEHLAATRDVFRTSHEGTREWSPFNYELVARVIHGDSLVGAAFGKHVTIDGSGGVDVEPLNDEGRRELLVATLGMSEEIVSQLPDDMPTPPAPWARSASDTWLGKRSEQIEIERHH